MQHTTSDEAIIFENIDTLVLCLGQKPENALEDALQSWIEAHSDASSMKLIAIGDCMAPCTAEEAVYEGLKAGWKI
jgi:hypothetical protein